MTFTKYYGMVKTFLQNIIQAKNKKKTVKHYKIISNKDLQCSIGAYIKSRFNKIDNGKDAVIFVNTH